MNQRRNRRKYRRGFTLFEIKVAIAITGLVVSLSVPAFLQARARTRAVRILDDCHRLDEAIREWAAETGEKEGSPIDVDRVRTYLQKPEGKLTDELGNPYQLGVVGLRQIAIDGATKFELAGAGIDWGAC